VLTLALRARGFRGDLFVGIIGTTVVATIINHATNHSAFCGPATLREILRHAHDEVLIVDPWNCFGVAQVFAYGAEVASFAEA
jgi:hypothetical protein